MESLNFGVKIGGEGELEVSKSASQKSEVGVYDEFHSSLPCSPAPLLPISLLPIPHSLFPQMTKF
jgi:hypothetical protein